MINREHCRPPINDQVEFQKIAASAASYKTEPFPPFLPFLPGMMLTRLSPGRCASRHGAAHQETPEMFPPPLDLLVAASEHTEAHPAAVASQFLVAVGNVIGRQAYTHVGETRHGTNENVLLVGSTSTGRKGDAKNGYGLAPLEDADPDGSANITGGLSSGEGLIHAVRDPVHAVNKKGEDVLADPGVADKRLLCVETEFSSVLKQFRA